MSEARDEADPAARAPRGASHSRAMWTYRWPLAIYLAVLACSWAFELFAPHVATRQTNLKFVDLSSRSLRIAYREWTPNAESSNRSLATSRPVVLLIHGSPGDGEAFTTTAKPLVEMGYRVIAPDLPGFGASSADPMGLSIRTHAEDMLAMMDALHIERTHVVGWSLGGGVAMNMADMAPQRLASLTLLASISDQESEGSGSYTLEHVKYAAGYTATTLARLALPHFGLLHELDAMRASMRNFWDTDMRPLGEIMRRVRTPTLILHGKDDPLVPLWAARHSHELIGPSRLIVTPYSHFMPFMQGAETGRTLGEFFVAHDEPSAASIDRSEEIRTTLSKPLLGRMGTRAWEAIHSLPWWTVLLIVIGVVIRYPRFGASLIFCLVSFSVIDIGYAAIGVPLAWLARAFHEFVRGRRDRSSNVFGSGIHARSPRLWRIELDRRPVRHGLGAMLVPRALDSLWNALGGLGEIRVLPVLFSLASCFIVTFVLIIAMFVGTMWIVEPLVAHLGFLGAIVGSVLVAWLAWIVPLLFTRTGWRVLAMRAARTTHKEYWPTLVLYLLLTPEFVRSGLRHGPSAFTACNPTIPGAGGMIGESKSELLRALNDPCVLPSIFIPANVDDETRMRLVLDAIDAKPELGGFPVILKPDRGLRGHAVKLARTPEDMRLYFQNMRAEAIVQRWHAGPCECGILWVKDAKAVGDATKPAGFIAGITRKEFPILVGDGRHTLEQLIWRHPRFHRQAGAFLERFADDRDRVLAEGERLRLAQSGNHCQGTLFRDGADLITPELAKEIDRVARGFALGGAPAGECELDMTRFDIRYESDELLKRGEGWAIVEINGTAGEATNIYDPDRSFAWMWSTLAQQWRWLYELGARRRRQGVRGMPLLRLTLRAKRFFRSVSGSNIAD